MIRYSESHEWVKVEGEVAIVGITDQAQKELGEVVYVELPVTGHTVSAGDEVVVLESTKAAVDIYTPLSGEIIEINTELRQHPEKVNNSPESGGWFFKIALTDRSELDKLSNA